MFKIHLTKRNTAILLGVILILAFLIRIYNLTLLPVFVDEAIYVRWSQVMAAVPLLRFLPLSDGKQPLYMWVLMFLVNRFSDPLFIGRFISVVCGLFTTVGVFALSRELFKSRLAGLASAMIWTLSPFAVFFDRMALVDSMLTALGIWVFYFAILTFRKLNLKYALITGFILGLGMLTKSPALFMLLMIPFAWFFAERPVRLIKLTALTLVIWVIAFGMYNVQRLDANFHLLASRNLDYVYPYGHILSSPLDPLKGHLGGIWNYFVLMGPVSLVFLVVFGLLSNFKKFKKEILFLLILGLVPIFIISEYSKAVTSRYILFTIPFFVILGASAFTAFSQKKNQLLKFLVWLIAAGFGFQGLLFDYQLLTNVEAAPLPHGERNGYLEEWTAGQGIKEIADFLKKEVENIKETDPYKPGGKIVVGTEGFFGTLPDGLQVYLNGEDKVVVIGVGLAIQEVPKSLRESRDFGNKTYLVVNKSRLAGDPDKMGLKLIQKFDKPPRSRDTMEYYDFGPQESLYFFALDSK